MIICPNCDHKIPDAKRNGWSDPAYKIGHKFNSWTYLGKFEPIFLKRDSTQQTSWKLLCKCECGLEKWHWLANLQGNKSKSCRSCSKKVNRAFYYGMSDAEFKHKKALIDKRYPNK